MNKSLVTIIFKSGVVFKQEIDSVQESLANGKYGESGIDYNQLLFNTPDLHIMVLDPKSVAAIFITPVAQE